MKQIWLSNLTVKLTRISRYRKSPPSRGFGVKHTLALTLCQAFRSKRWSQFSRFAKADLVKTSLFMLHLLKVCVVGQKEWTSLSFSIPLFHEECLGPRLSFCTFQWTESFVSGYCWVPQSHPTQWRLVWLKPLLPRSHGPTSSGVHHSSPLLCRKKDSPKEPFSIPYGRHV